MKSIFSKSKKVLFPSKHKVSVSMQMPYYFSKGLKAFSISTDNRKVLSWFLNAYSKLKAESLDSNLNYKTLAICPTLKKYQGPALKISSLLFLNKKLFALSCVEICNDGAKAMESKAGTLSWIQGSSAPNDTGNTWYLLHRYKLAWGKNPNFVSNVIDKAVKFDFIKSWLFFNILCNEMESNRTSVLPNKV